MIRVMYLLLTAALLTHTACGQNQSEEKIPEAVRTSFTTKFPEAKNVQWDRENDASYEAEFKSGKQEVSATFNTEGTWIETETIIKKSALPEAVQSALARDYSMYKVNEAAKIEMAQNEIRYEAEIEKGEESFDVLYSADGKELSKNALEQEEDDED